ncbi:hypothetical protein BDQ17DRAFT_1330964 [Cyathus striatus]|nr:hypothetical protein BDQ17DRAFT_1330964 [Cyathus striatus]
MLARCINSTWIAEATLRDPTQQPRTVWRGMKKKSIHIRCKVKLVIIENDDELEVQPPLKPKLITAKLGPHFWPVSDARRLFFPFRPFYKVLASFICLLMLDRYFLFMDIDPPLPDMDDLVDLPSIIAEFEKLEARGPRSAVRCNRCTAVNRACISSVLAQSIGQPCDPCLGTSSAFQCSFVLDDPTNMRVPHLPLPQVEPLAAAVAQRLPVVVEAQRTLQLLTVLANLQVAKYVYYLLDYVHAFRTALRRLGGIQGLQQRGLLSHSINTAEVNCLFRLASRVQTTAMSHSTLHTLEQFFTAATGSDIQAIGASHPLLLAQESYGIGVTNVIGLLPLLPFLPALCIILRMSTLVLLVLGVIVVILILVPLLNSTQYLWSSHSSLHSRLEQDITAAKATFNELDRMSASPS